MSAIFPHGDDQKKLAIKTRDREAARKGGKVHTVILPGSRFSPAEAIAKSGKHINVEIAASVIEVQGRRIIQGIFKKAGR